jgi:hypothetical protein
MASMQPTRLTLAGHLPDSSGEPPTGVVTPAVSGPPGAPIAGIPQNGADLGELSQDEYNLEESAALSLGFSVATLEDSAKHDVLIFQAARFKDVAVQGATYRFGVSVEATIVVTTDKFQGSLTLPVVAANVQLSFAKASSTLAVRGYLPQANKPIHLPAWGSFDVGSYADFQAVVSKLQDAVLFDNDNIRPVLLATTEQPQQNAAGKAKPHWYSRL